jgi:hypothetical protein
LSKIDKFLKNLKDDNETVALFENSKLFTEDDIKIMKEGLKNKNNSCWIIKNLIFSSKN